MDISTHPEDIPTREDGTPYAVALVSTTSTLFADSFDELVAQLIPDYPVDQDTDEEVEEADALRYAYMVREADTLQERYAKRAIDNGFLTADADETIRWIVTAPRSEHIALPGDRWDIAELPVVLVTSNYAPFSEHVAPTGDALVWLDPTDSRTYIQSLAKAANARVFEHPEGGSDQDVEQSAATA